MVGGGGVDELVAELGGVVEFADVDFEETFEESEMATAVEMVGMEGEVLAEELETLGLGGVGFGLGGGGFFEGVDILEEATADHDAINTGLVDASAPFPIVHDIPVADDEGLFVYLVAEVDRFGDFVPVGGDAGHVGDGAAVDGDDGEVLGEKEADPFFSLNFSEADAGFDADGEMAGAGFGGGDDVGGTGVVVDEGGADAMFEDGFLGTAHVEVDAIEAEVGDDAGGGFEVGEGVAPDLGDDGALVFGIV